jgi:uncharacterized RDD family membrane protein YckC
MDESNQEVKYAGFFTRLLATLVDIAAVSFVINIVGSAITLNTFIILAIWWLYVSIMLIKWRATIGGKLFGIEVLKSDDLKPLSFKWASIRFFVSIAPFFLYLYLRGMQHMMDMPPSPSMSQLPQLIFMLLPMVMFFTKKKQMIHDFVVHSVVIDVNVQMNIKEAKQNKSVHVGQKILRIVGTLAFLAIFGYLLFYVSVLYMLSKSSQNSYNASFSTHYKTNNYNDSRIIFYNKELEKYSEEFIDANSMYDIFEADVKKDLSLGCIQYFIRRKNRETWIDEGSKYRKNARNKYANTEDKIKKAKQNSDYMGHHFYTFDLNIVNHVVDDVTKVWSDKNESVCKNKLSTNELYEIFVRQYIARFDNENIHSQFGSKPQQREIDWFNILKEKRSDIFQQIQHQKERIKEDEKRAEEARIERNRKKIEQRRLKEIKVWKDNDEALRQLKKILFIEKKNFQEIDALFAKVQNIDFWIDGNHQGNLLYQAIKLNDLNASKILLDKGASTVKTSAIMNLALSNSVNVKLFELILLHHLKPKNYRNINMLLINAIEQNSSNEKVKIILTHMSEVKKEYFYVVESAIKACRDSQLISLLLSKDTKLNQNERLFALLHKTAYKCPNKKEIEELFTLKKEIKLLEVKALKSKFIRFNN